MHPQKLVPFVVAVAVCGAAVDAQQVTKETVPGIRNFARVETTVACAGAITPEVVPVIEGVVVGVARVQDGTWTHFRLHPPPEAPCTSGQ